MPAVSVVRFGLGLTGLMLVGLGATVSASAQGAGANCSDIQSTLTERKALVEKIETIQKTKKKPTPQEVCTIFTKLTTNGATAVKWLDANKDWCSIPDTFAEGFKNDHKKVSEIRGKTCDMAAKAAIMQKRAAQAQSAPQNQLYGGPGLSGSFKMPQGAM